MKSRLIAAAVASMSLGFAAQSFAQSNDGKTFTHGESKRCESMSGVAKDQCDREEATKTEGSSTNERSSTGSSSAGSTFTHGESKRCESMSGAARDQCDKEEATKTQGDAAREASKSEPSK
jgi:hypothetical protein